MAPNLAPVFLLLISSVAPFCPTGSRPSIGSSTCCAAQQLLDLPTTKALTAALSKVDRLATKSNTNAVLAPFFESCSQNCLKAPSGIANAGMGLFAAQNITQGSIITFYPMHCLGVDFGESSVRVSRDENKAYFAEESLDYVPDYVLNLLGSRPIPSLPPQLATTTLFVDVNPSRDDDPGWLSHYINDGAIVAANSEAGMLQYYKYSADARNCVIVPFGPAPLMVTVATKDIRKGQELFTSYGAVYWLQQLLDMSENEEEITDFTDDIQKAAKASAVVLFETMKGISQERVAVALQSFFDEDNKKQARPRKAKKSRSSKGFGS